MGFVCFWWVHSWKTREPLHTSLTRFMMAVVSWKMNVEMNAEAKRKNNHGNPETAAEKRTVLAVPEAGSLPTSLRHVEFL